MIGVFPGEDGVLEVRHGERVLLRGLDVRLRQADRVLTWQDFLAALG